MDNRTDGQLSTRVATITDGTHTPVERSKNSAWNKATYSGKKKTHTYNTNITIALPRAPQYTSARPYRAV